MPKHIYLTLFKLGETLRRIHSVPQEPFHASGLFPDDTVFNEVKARFRESFDGLIDFDDAYVSHPAGDLRRWNLPKDREAVLAGYTSGREIDDRFVRTWSVVMLLHDMMAVSYQTAFHVESEMDARVLVEQL